jgi:D-alanyl-D-alanine carboxypeptidase
VRAPRTPPARAHRAVSARRGIWRALVTASLAPALVAGAVFTAAMPADARVSSGLAGVAVPLATSAQLSGQIVSADELTAALVSSDARIAAVDSSLEALSLQAGTLWTNRSLTWTAQVAAEAHAVAQGTRLAQVNKQVQVARAMLRQAAGGFWVGGAGPEADVETALTPLSPPAPNQTATSVATLTYLVSTRARQLRDLEAAASSLNVSTIAAEGAAAAASAAARAATKAKAASETLIAAQRTTQRGLWAGEAVQISWAPPVQATLLRAGNPGASAAERALATALAGRDYTLLMSQSSTCGIGRTNYPNGQWPPSALCPLLAAPDKSLRRSSALAFDAMSHTYEEQTGSPLCVTEGYRSLSDQIAIKAATPTLGAVPGTSKHGLGLAIDLCGGVQTFTSAAHLWMNRNAHVFGWMHPAWAEPQGVLPEPWHWEFVG